MSVIVYFFVQFVQGWPIHMILLFKTWYFWLLNWKQMFLVQILNVHLKTRPLATGHIFTIKKWGMFGIQMVTVFNDQIELINLVFNFWFDRQNILMHRNNSLPWLDLNTGFVKVRYSDGLSKERMFKGSNLTAQPLAKEQWLEGGWTWE